MGEKLASVSNMALVMNKSMLLQLEIAIKEIEGFLDKIELEMETYGFDKESNSWKIIQELNASICAQQNHSINMVQINNIDIKSMNFILGIKDVLKTLKEKIKFYKTIEMKS